MRIFLGILLLISYSSLCFSQEEGEIPISIFSYSKKSEGVLPGSCVALIAWNKAARKVFIDPLPKQFCKWELGVQAIPILDERLKAKGLKSGYSPDRLIVFNLSPNITDRELTLLLIAGSGHPFMY